MHRATGFHHQPRQQGILFRRKIQRRFTQPHRAASDVKAQIADADFIIARLLCRRSRARMRALSSSGKGFYRSHPPRYRDR